MVRNLAKTLIENNYFAEVDVCSSNVIGKSELLNNNNRNIKIMQFNISKLNNLWITHSYEYKNYIDTNIMNYDLIHIHEMWHYFHYYTAKLAIKKKVPFIITPHGGLEKRRLNNIKKKIFAYFIEKKICRRARYVHALTKFEESDIKSLEIRAKTVVIPNGVELPRHQEKSNTFRQEYSIPKKAKVILFLGRLNIQKGVLLLIQSFIEMVKNNKNWVLVLAGPDEHNFNKKYQNKVENIIFTGLVTGKQKEELFQGVDVLIMPSFGEGFSMSILEAMSYRLPVIISKYCYFPDIEKNNAGIEIELNKNSIYNALKTILNNQNISLNMGNNAFRLVREKYNLNKSVINIYKLYQDAIKRS